AQNEMLAYQQKESTARVASIMENTNLSKQQQVSEIMRQMLTQAQTAGQYFTNDQIKEMTRKVSAEVDLVHQQTQNQRYGSSHRGFGPLLEDKLCLIFKLAPSVCRMTFPILASLLVRLVVLLPFQLLRLSLATPSRWTPLALSVFLHCVVALLLTLL